MNLIPLKNIEKIKQGQDKPDNLCVNTQTQEQMLLQTEVARTRAKRSKTEGSHLTDHAI